MVTLRPRVTSGKLLLATLSAATIALSAPVARAANRPAPAPTCASAEALMRGGEEAEAKKVFVQVLLNEPTSECAVAGLTAIGGKVPKSASPCEQGEAFESLHRYNDAEAAFKTELEKDPSSECAKNGLERVGPSAATTFLAEAAGDVPYALIALGFLLLAYFLIAMLAYLPGIGTSFRRRGPYRALLAPRLSVSDLKDDALGEEKAGGPFAARIKERMSRMRDEARDFDDAEDPSGLDFSTPSEEFADIVSSAEGGLKSTLDSLSDVSDQTKVIAALFNAAYAVLPIPRLSVSGCLEPAAEKCPAATLVLEDGSTLSNAVTLTGVPATSDPKAADYLTLTDSAAIWAQYEIARLLDNEQVRLDGAESWALVRKGLEAYRAANQAEGADRTALAAQAREFFAEAMRLNRGTWAAYLGAALTEARLVKRFEHAIEILEEALREMKEES